MRYATLDQRIISGDTFQLPIYFREGLKPLRQMLLVGLLLLSGLMANAQVSGRVFRDFNADARPALNVAVTAAVTSTLTAPTAGTVAEPGIGGVTVVATRPDGSTVATTTTSTGGYAFSAAQLPAGEQVRIEFVWNLPGTFSGPQGSANGTSVQFVTAGAATTAVSFALNCPADYCQANPPLLTSCFDDHATGLANFASLVRFNTDQVKLVTPAAVKSANGFAKAGLMVETAVEDQAAVGSVLGLAYHRGAKKLFSAAFVKVHEQRGAGAYPNGIGAIYITDLALASPTSSTFVLVSGVGALTGASGAAAQGDVGRKGLGDLELSPAEDALYTINIATKSLIRIPLIVNGSTVTAGTPVVIPMTAPSDCSNNAYPFGLQFNKEKLYVTWTCDGAGAGIPLKGYVYEFDGVSAFTEVLNVDFRYGRAADNANYNTEDNDHTFTDWNTYGDPVALIVSNSTTEQDRARARYTRSQPWLTDLAFDKGDMVLGVRSRLGDVFNKLFFVKGGDLLRASANDSNSPTSWTLESNGTSGTTTVTVPTLDPNTGLSGATTRSLGPGTTYPAAVDISTLTSNASANARTFSYPTIRREYYWNDDGWEGESTNGGLLQIPGYPNVYVTQNDWLGHGGQHGLVAMNNTTGVGSFAGNVFYGFDDNNAWDISDNNIAKSGGLGDLVALCNPAPIEIGNRVWYDLNKNGLQDPTETPIASVSVGLYQSGTLVAQAQTNTKGEYYFSSATGTNPTDGSAKYGLALTPGATYELRILTTQTALSSYSVGSPVEAGTDPALDNDFSPAGATLTRSFTLGAAGQTLHTFDAAVVCAAPTAISVAVTAATCSNTTGQNNGTVVLTSAPQNTDRYALVSGTATAGLAYSAATVLTAPYPKTLITNGPNAGQTYTIRFFNGSNDCFTDEIVTMPVAECQPVCSLSVVVGTLGGSLSVCSNASATLLATVSPVGSYTYSWVAPPDVSLTNASSATALATPTSLSLTGLRTFTVTVSSSPTCSTTATITVSYAPAPLLGTSVATCAAPGSYSVAATLSFTGITALISAGIPTVVGTSLTVANIPLGTLVSYTLTSAAGCAVTGTLASLSNCPPTPLGSLGDRVWKDVDRNGQQDSGEPGVDGVTVRLLRETTPGTFSLVSTTITVGGGTYLFSGLPTGTYVVEFDKTTLPPLCVLSPNVAAPGVPPALNSDADPTTGRSGLLLIDPTDPARTNLLDIDAGLEPVCEPVCLPIATTRVR